MDYHATRGQKLHEELLQKVAERHHELIEGVYETNDSSITLKCKIHGVNHQTIAGNYKRAAFGMPCCMAARQGRRYKQDLQAYLEQSSADVPND